MLSPVGGPSWMMQTNALQPRLNEAIRELLEHDNAAPLKGLVNVMQTMSILSDKEAAAVLEALER
jgi:hypothetical protein